MDDQCPRVKVATNEIRDLSYEERLNIFQNEAVSLYEFCSKKGFTSQEIDVCVSKLYGPPKSKKRKALDDSWKTVFVLAILLALSSALYASPKANNFVSAHVKLFTIQYVLPHWNYAKLWNEDCLIDNKWLPADEEIKLDKEGCKYCSNIVKHNNNTIDRVQNLNKKGMSKDYISLTQPVVILDGMKDWNSLPLDMDVLSKLYQTHPVLTSSMGSCAYSTSVNDFSTFYDFITAYTDRTLPGQWHARWENCDVKSAKIIRKYYQRLYCCPDSTQSGQFNTIIAGKGVSNERLKLEVELTQGRWLVVVSGSIKGFFSPQTECVEKFGCATTEFLLEAGQAVFYYPNSWDLEYTITNDEEITLAISTGLVWDTQ